MGVVRRFDVFLIRLDPTLGAEIKKTRPCLIVSPNEMNRYSRTVIVAPMTTAGPSFPTRIPCEFSGKSGQVVLDQLRAVDKSRLGRKLGKIGKATQSDVLAALQELFAP
jgi:mRNA interferase MazF